MLLSVLTLLSAIFSVKNSKADSFNNRRILTSSVPDIFDMVFLIDNSGSPNDTATSFYNNFLKIRLFPLKIIPIINSTDSRVAIYQNGYDDRRILNLTNEWDAVEASFFYLNGDRTDFDPTKDLRAYQEAENIIFESFRPQAISIVFVITESQYREDILTQAERLRSKGVKIIEVFVDKLRQGSYSINQRVADPNLFFRVENYEGLNDDLMKRVSFNFCEESEEYNGKKE